MCPRLNNQFQLISISQCSCSATVPQICFGAIHFSTSRGEHTHGGTAGTVQGGIRTSQEQKGTAVYIHCIYDPLPPQVVKVSATDP